MEGRVCTVGRDVCSLDKALGHWSKPNLLWTSPNQPLSIMVSPALLLLSWPIRRIHLHQYRRRQTAISKYTQISCVSEACSRASFNWQILNDILRSVSSASGREREMNRPGQRQRFWKSPLFKPAGLTFLSPIQYHIKYILNTFIYITFMHCTSFTCSVQHFYCNYPLDIYTALSLIQGSVFECPAGYHAAILY